jgi:hypothetical protein
MSPKRYRITVRGRLTDNLGSAFDGMTLDQGPEKTALVGDRMDQSQLFGVLDRLRDFGIELISVEEITQ